jgi:hypothetical protein
MLRPEDASGHIDIVSPLTVVKIGCGIALGAVLLVLMLSATGWLLK